MAKIKIYLCRLIAAAEESKLRKAILSPLTLLSFVYGGVVLLRRFLYARRILSVHSLPCKVISVGNITLGGTGKTPFASLLAQMVRSRGYRVVLLSRGYGGNFSRPCAVVSDGEKILLPPEQAGDEPYLLAQKGKGVPVIIGPQRRISGNLAVRNFRAEVVILDDGFQHLALGRDLDLLLLDSRVPFGNGYLFPRGVLREPRSQIARADAVILTKAGRSASMEKLNKDLAGIRRQPIFRVRYQAEAIRVAGEETVLAPGVLRGKKILAFAGLARPESFRETLGELGARVEEMETFPDHYAYQAGDLSRIKEKARQLGVDALVTTEKDIVRLQGFHPGSPPLWVLAVGHVFLGEDGARFEDFLFRTLNL